jgi:uncharacterized membrane protein
MAAGSASAAAFHDITSGNNGVPGLTGYTAASGYDMATGLGSVDASNLVAQWSNKQSAPSLQLSLAQSTLEAVIPSSPSAIAVTVTGSGLSSAVALSATGLPTGVTASFTSPSLSASGSSNLQLTIGSKVAAGTYSINVVGSSGTLKAQSALSITVAAPVAPVLSLAAASTKLSIAAGAHGTVALSSTGNSGISSAVAFSIGGLPTGMTASFSPASIAAPGTGSSTLTLSNSSAVAGGSYTVTVTAKSGSTAKSLSLTVNVPAMTASLNSSTMTLASTTSKSVTLTTKALGGFSERVSFSVSGLPSGVAATFGSASIAAPGAGSSTVQFTASSSAKQGVASVTLTASGGGVTVTLPLTLTVTPAPSFTFATTATAAHVVAGSNTTVKFASAAQNGFSSSIALSVSGLPAGVTAKFAPASISAGQSATLTITAAKSAGAGSATLTVTATSGSLSVAIPIALTITAH